MVYFCFDLGFSLLVDLEFVYFGCIESGVDVYCDVFWFFQEGLVWLEFVGIVGDWYDFVVDVSGEIGVVGFVVFFFVGGDVCVFWEDDDVKVLLQLFVVLFDDLVQSVFVGCVVD